MPWQHPAIQFPPAAKALRDGIVAAALAQGRSEIDTARSRLHSVEAAFVKNPTAATAAGSAALDNTLRALFGADLHLLVVHPYQEGVGQGHSYSRHLSAPNAQRALAAKLGDAWDRNKPVGALEAVAVLLATQTLGTFATGLHTLCQWLPLPELCQAERRTQQLLRLESEKSQLPGAPLGGHWQPRRLTQLHTARSVAQVIGAEIASAMGYALENTDPLAELHTLAEKKQQHLDAVRAATETLVADLNGRGMTHCLYASGSPRQIAGQIQAAHPFDHDHVFCAALLFAAPVGALAPLQELFGL
ncbi:hypothetical protein ACL7TT_17240 [Microbulbifer sp. 2304DJ12-6]|uniref:hypothetical protein n=1 Tax=Microbulbifer sp. 2304DJ12-6 TaxID=3233340 RepID=UPI0039AFBF62